MGPPLRGHARAHLAGLPERHSSSGKQNGRKLNRLLVLKYPYYLYAKVSGKSSEVTSDPKICHSPWTAWEIWSAPPL